jgi:hypothetical protein
MQLTNPNAVYSIMYEQIVGKRVAPANAALFLDEFFKKKDKTKVLLQAQHTRVREGQALKLA